MRLKHIALQDFRNVPLCALDLAGMRSFFLGANGQGKTNLLEAAGLAGAVRSFRTREIAALIRRDTQEARVLLRFETEHAEIAEVEIRITARTREVFLNGIPVERLADFLGQFPVVALSSDDMRLLRGAPAERRRPFDLLFSCGSRDYFEALRRYHGAMRARNELLRAQMRDAAQYRGFEGEMARSAEILVKLRAEGCAALEKDLRQAYLCIAGEDECPGISYAPACPAQTQADWAALFERNRPREQLLQKTVDGPHRDDYRFLLNGTAAKEFASEGQQRGLVVSWRLAQARWLERERQTTPLLIADDILGELDPVRRKGFWRAVPPRMQVLASGTALPEKQDEGVCWQVWRVQNGAFFLASENDSTIVA